MRLEWTEPAISDLQDIRDYIKKDSKHYAARFVEKVIDAAENLLQFPDMGRNVPESEAVNIKELLFHNYRIMYRIEHDRILILTIIHGTRDLSLQKQKPWDVV